jgi:hypothetical protein
MTKNPSSGKTVYAAIFSADWRDENTGIVFLGLFPTKKEAQIAILTEIDKREILGLFTEEFRHFAKVDESLVPLWNTVDSLRANKKVEMTTALFDAIIASGVDDDRCIPDIAVRKTQVP